MSLSAPPVLAAHFRYGKRIQLGQVVQANRAGLTGPVTITPNTTFVRQIIQTGICNGAQIAEVLNGEGNADEVLSSLDALNLGTIGACWKVSCDVEAVQTGNQQAGQNTTTINRYQIIWQQVIAAAPSFTP